MTENIKIAQGDCLELMKDIPDGSIDMVLADPPYGITSRNKWDKVIPFEPMWEQLHRITRKNTPILMFAQLPFGSDLIQSNRKEYRYEWIWNKNFGCGYLNANRMPLRCHENILVFYRKLPKYNPQFWLAEKAHMRGGTGSSTNYGENHPIPHTPPTRERYPLDIIKFSNASRNKTHPTEKPVNLLEYLIETYTDEGYTVLDFCMGSGSTGVACQNTNRKFIGFELDKKYFEIAKNRLGL